MTFYYKGLLTTDPGEHYLAVSRSGFMRDSASKKIVQDSLASVSFSGGLPLGTVVKIEKLYRMGRGYEPNAPFRHGDLAEVWTLRLKAHGAWHDPKTGKAKPAKWETIEHASRSRSGEGFKERGKKDAPSDLEWIHQRHERGENPNVRGKVMTISAVNDARTSAKINAIRLGAGNPGTHCPTCGRSAYSPYTRHDGRRYTEGCIDAFHHGHTPPGYGEFYAKQTARENRRENLRHLEALSGSGGRGSSGERARARGRAGKPSEDPLERRIRRLLGRGSEPE